jgi:hypothetical protein
MVDKKKTIRGLQDIRTLSGRVDMISEPYRAFMRITALEMEKERRGIERRSAVQRVQNIDARFRDIEAEKDALLTSLGEREKGRSPSTSYMKSKEISNQDTGSFKIRY